MAWVDSHRPAIASSPPRLLAHDMLLLTPAATVKHVHQFRAFVPSIPARTMYVSQRLGLGLADFGRPSPISITRSSRLSTGRAWVEKTSSPSAAAAGSGNDAPGSLPEDEFDRRSCRVVDGGAEERGDLPGCSDVCRRYIHTTPPLAAVAERVAREGPVRVPSGVDCYGGGQEPTLVLRLRPYQHHQGVCVRGGPVSAFRWGLPGSINPHVVFVWPGLRRSPVSSTRGVHSSQREIAKASIRRYDRHSQIHPTPGLELNHTPQTSQYEALTSSPLPAHKSG
ncbi:Leucine-rich repeat receptor-like protein kinase [Marssonina coronariae]|uniref:Leucine-rich repeat receptor-like protein kinase n=1 Tax=Diplocarpon coronariae TaxID=2795749 RepID=A0A218YT73_9HELO|nr:Leucine-rich repeat receptor-like protein kinase [Marssonina coronariae]